MNLGTEAPQLVVPQSKTTDTALETSSASGENDMSHTTENPATNHPTGFTRYQREIHEANTASNTCPTLNAISNLATNTQGEEQVAAPQHQEQEQQQGDQNNASCASVPASHHRCCGRRNIRASAAQQIQQQGDQNELNCMYHTHHHPRS